MSTGTSWMVSANPGGVDLEPHLVEVVVVGIEEDRDLVGRQRVERAVVAIARQQLIATRERRADTSRPHRLRHLRPDVDRLVVVEDPDLGGQRGRIALARLRLPELRDRRGSAPCLLIELAVDSDG